MSVTKKFGIIIITYNRANDLLSLLKNIATLNFKEELLEEVIIINNKSTESYSTVNSFIKNNPHIPFKYTETDENLGVSRGRNFAISQSKAPFLILVDDDAEFQDENTLSIINKSTSENKDVGIIAMKVLYYHNNEIQRSSFPHKLYREKKDLINFHTYYFVGCGNIIKREALDKAGLFPTTFFYGMEEYDLSYRILDLGYKILYDSRIVLLHKESPEGRQTKSIKLRGMWVNKSIVAWRYLPILYFISTSIIWSFFFLYKTKFDLINFMKGWKIIINIPSTEKRYLIKKETLNYIKSLKARLAY
jgi:GT2 family glycosyltransferase